MKLNFTEEDFDVPGMIDILPEEMSKRVPRRLKENDQIVLEYLLSIQHLSLSNIQDKLSSRFDFYTLAEIEDMLKYV